MVITAVGKEKMSSAVPEGPETALQAY